ALYVEPPLRPHFARPPPLQGYGMHGSILSFSTTYDSWGHDHGDFRTLVCPGDGWRSQLLATNKLEFLAKWEAQVRKMVQTGRETRGKARFLEPGCCLSAALSRFWHTFGQAEFRTDFRESRSLQGRGWGGAVGRGEKSADLSLADRPHPSCRVACPRQTTKRRSSPEGEGLKNVPHPLDSNPYPNP
ncbi:MAG: hypothetical protein RL367_1988, partial [Pseudomonadota bacterium]